MAGWIDKQGRRHVAPMVNGQRVHRILPPGATASDAKRLDAELRNAIGSARVPNIPGDPRLSDVMTLYVTHADTLRSTDTALHHARRIGLWVEKYRASQARQCATHIVKDMSGHYKPATINRSLGTLKKALRLAWEAGHVAVDYSTHVKRLPEHNTRDDYMTLEQVRAMASHCTTRVQAAIWLALLTGARRGEIVKLRPEDIGRDTLILHYGNTKTLKTRTVPIVAAARPWLKHIPLDITFEGIKTAWRRAREAEGMPHMRFHDLRHSCASILIASGADLYTVSKILGHASTRTTERYAHMDVRQQRKALKKAFG